MKTSIMRLLAVSPWILRGGYLGMFVGMLIEGPWITAFGGCAVKMGIMNVWLVFLYSVLGNFIPDVVFYAIGFWGREKFIDMHGARFGISKERMQAIEKLYEDHPISTLLVVKLIPFLPATGLAAAGAARMPLGKYSFWSLIIVLLTSALYMATGYYSGEAYLRIAHYEMWSLAILAVCIFLFIWGFNKTAGLLGKKLAPKVGL